MSHVKHSPEEVLDAMLDGYHGGENWRDHNNPEIERERMRDALRALEGWSRRVPGVEPGVRNGMKPAQRPTP